MKLEMALTSHALTVLASPTVQRQRTSVVNVTLTKKTTVSETAAACGAAVLCWTTVGFVEATAPAAATAQEFATTTDQMIAREIDAVSAMLIRPTTTFVTATGCAYQREALLLERKMTAACVTVRTAARTALAQVSMSPPVSHIVIQVATVVVGCSCSKLVTAMS